MFRAGKLIVKCASETLQKRKSSEKLNVSPIKFNCFAWAVLGVKNQTRQGLVDCFDSKQKGVKTASFEVKFGVRLAQNAFFDSVEAKASSRRGRTRGSD